jgi:hypothetical protein
MIAVQANRTKPLTIEEFMMATGQSVPCQLTDKLWTSYYEDPQSLIYIDDEMIAWAGLGGEMRTQKANFMRILDSCYILYHIILDIISVGGEHCYDIEHTVD